MSFASYSFAFQEINNSIYFPRVAQGHGSCSDAPNPQFTQNNSAKITGTGGQALAFCSSNLGAGLPSDGCDGQQCEVTGSLSTPSLSLTRPNSFPIWNSNKTIECSTTQSTSINTLNQVNLNSRCELTFLPNNNGYRIKNFQLNQNAKAILTSGDYWFKSANFAQNSQLVIDGDVRIFILGNTQISGSQLNATSHNATSTGNLTIVAYGSISLNDRSIVNGYIYAADQLTLNNNSVLNGRVTAKRLTMSDSSRINQFEQQGYTCFSDDFNRSSLGQNWVPFTSSGSFTPSISSNRLRLTEAIKNQATAVTYQRVFPTVGNLVQVELDYYAWANLTGNGADGIGIIFSDAAVTPRTGGFGGSLGYAPHTDATPSAPGFAGGWLGIGLDEWGNFSNPTEGRVGGDGFSPQSITVRGSEASNYRYITHQTVSPNIDLRSTNTPGPGDRYLIEIDSRNANANQVLLSIRRTNNNTTTTIFNQYSIPLNQQGAIPEEFFLSLAGSTGDSVNHHEIENFRVCALKSREVGELIDHFRIIHTGQGVTCSAESVTVIACKNTDCSELFTDPVQATLSPATISDGGGWVGGNIINFSGGSTTVELRKNQPGTITLDVTGSSPATKSFATTLCQTGGGWSASHCSINFADSGFVIDVPDLIANSSATATIKAVKTSDASLQCVPEFANVDKTINFWSSYLAPDSSSVVGSPAISISSVEIGKSQELASAIPMTFNASGEASFTLNYPDAGHMQLNARYQGSGAEDGLLMVGDDQFVSFPKYLQISAQRTSNKDYGNNNINGECPSADTSCRVFSAAGEAFNLLVTAYGAGDVVTPNYQHSNMALTHTLVAPASGQAGTISTASYQQVPVNGGTNTVAQSVSEVGVFNFTVTPQGAFQGSNTYTIAAANTGNIGRFTPYYLHLEGNTPSFSQACNTFTYLGQAMKFDRLPEISVAGRFYDELGTNGEGETENYKIGSWWRYSNPWLYRNFSAQSSDFNITDTETLGLLNPQEGFAWPGSVVIDTSNFIARLENAQIRYDKPYAPVEPIAEGVILQLSIDDTKDLDGVCYQTSAGSGCIGYDFPSSESQNQRWGRLLIHDTYGPETTPLSQKVEAQYFSGERFLTNSDDSCSDLGSVNHFDFDPTDFTVLKSGTATPPEVKATLAPSLLSAGFANINFSAPGAENTGTIVSSYDLSTLLPWLSVDEDGNNSFDDSVAGQVQFGLYRGNDRVIWWRELN